MAREIAERHQGFAGGVFMFNNPAPDQAYNISNMIIDPDGRAYKRQGSGYQTRIPPLGKQILSMFVWYRFNNPTQLLAHAEDGHLYYTTDFVSWTDGGSGLSLTEPASFDVGYAAGHQTTPPTYDLPALNAPCVYMADGSALWRWSGSALLNMSTGVSAAPVGRYVCWWKDTLWILTGRVNSDPEHLYGSAAGNADTWPPLLHVRIGVGDGDYCTALFSASQDMIVSKKRRTFTILEPVNLTNRVTDYEKGVESHWSVVKFDQEVYYITHHGIARYIQGAPAEIVSANIQPLFTPVFLNQAQMEKCHGYHVFHRVGWTLVRQGNTYPDFQIEYYPQYPRRPWTFHRMPARTFATVRDTSERLFFAMMGPNDPRLYEAFQLGTLLDDGQAYSGMIETIWSDFNDPLNRKYLRAIRMWGDGKIHIQVKRDRRDALGQLMTADLVPPDPKWNEAGDKWSITDVWGTLGTIGTDIVYPDLYGRTFMVRFYDLPDAAGPVPNPRRGVADLSYAHPRGWSLIECTLEAVQMGELG